MNLSKILKNAFLIILASLVLTACATKKNIETNETMGQLQVMFTLELILLNI